MAISFSEGGLVTSAVRSFELVIDQASGDLAALSVPERMVMDYYEANWELGAMHCYGEDYDDER